MKELNEQQRHIVGVLLDQRGPVIAHDLVEELDLSATLIQNRLDTLVKAGWLTKGKAPIMLGARGVPPSEYALVAGARNKWDQTAF